MIDNTKPWHVGSGGTSTVLTRHEAKRFARTIVESDDYRKSVTRRIQDDNLAPAVEILLLHYAYGAPLKQVEVNATITNTHEMSLDEIRRAEKDLRKELDTIEALELAIPAEYKTA